jgi:hypothetical protein
VLEKTPGAHRFVWDLRWRSSGDPIADDEDSQVPSGPKAIPGGYNVRLTVDGKILSQPLRLIMDPRSPAKQPVLSEHLRLAKQVFEESMQSRRALAEMNAVQKQLDDLQKRLPAEDSQIRSMLVASQSEMSRILTRKVKEAEMRSGEQGLEGAYADLLSELRAVESGDRPVPSQAVAAYENTRLQIEARVREWEAFKRSKLPEVNRQLQSAGQQAITISEIENEVQFLMSR